MEKRVQRDKQGFLDKKSMEILMYYRMKGYSIKDIANRILKVKPSYLHKCLGIFRKMDDLSFLELINNINPKPKEEDKIW